MTNRNMLRSAIIRNGLTCADVAKAIGVNESTFSLKMSGKRDFYTHEVKKIAKVLHLNKEEVFLIFFAD